MTGPVRFWLLLCSLNYVIICNFVLSNSDTVYLLNNFVPFTLQPAYSLEAIYYFTLYVLITVHYLVYRFEIEISEERLFFSDEEDFKTNSLSSTEVLFSKCIFRKLKACKYNNKRPYNDRYLVILLDA